MKRPQHPQHKTTHNKTKSVLYALKNMKISVSFREEEWKILRMIVCCFAGCRNAHVLYCEKIHILKGIVCVCHINKNPNFMGDQFRSLSQRKKNSAEEGKNLFLTFCLQSMCFVVAFLLCVCLCVWSEWERKI